jgi:hypothetical protein
MTDATDTITRRRHPEHEIRNSHFATSPIGVTGAGGAPYGNSGMASVAQSRCRGPYDHQPGQAQFGDQMSGTDPGEKEVSFMRTPDPPRDCRMKDAGDLLVREGIG